jgi:tellurite resistance protein
LNQGNKPGSKVAIIASIVVALVIILIFPQILLILVGLLFLSGFVIYSFDAPKRKGRIGNTSQPKHKNNSTLGRVAQPSPPPPLQPTANSTPQKTSNTDNVVENKEESSIQQESSIEVISIPGNSLLLEAPAEAKRPSLEAGQAEIPKPGISVPPNPSNDNNHVPVTVALGRPDSVTFRIPRSPERQKKGLWIPCGEAITIWDTVIPGGMIYVGKSLKGDSGTNDPCLIDPTKPVAQQGDYTKRQMGYWPSYSEISSEARRAYLNWLSDGRRNPAADIGFVFLFFYGLERRLIVDILNDDSVHSDIRIITAELRRLISIYGDKSNSFNGYANEFLGWIMQFSYPSRLYDQPLPELNRSYPLPFHLRLALGQAAVDGKPLPPGLALSWAKLDRTINLRTPATRCSAQFEELFRLKYIDMFDQGLVLPRNKTKLGLVYQPASSGLSSRNPLIKVFHDIPDVTVLTAPIKKIGKVVNAATKDLEPFCRFIARNPLARDTFEGLIRLPISLWPDSSQQKLQQLNKKIAEGMMSIKYNELLFSLFEVGSASKDSIVHLARILESVRIGIEPNVLFGAKIPKPDDKIVLFAIPAFEDRIPLDGSFIAAEFTLQLASAVAAADGVFSVGEAEYLRSQVKAWGHLTEGHKRRLLAHVELLTDTPISLASLRKKIDKYSADDRLIIAETVAKVALVDGGAPPETIKMLERIYKFLGVSGAKVYSDLLVASPGSESSLQAASKDAGRENPFILNHDRIAARREDTEKVQTLLANIFNDSDELNPSGPGDILSQDSSPKVASREMLLGLDQAHSTLAKKMLARQVWSREELLQMTAELDLMLDGALEHINDAAFEAFDMPFIESDDPIVLNPEIQLMLNK